MAKKPGQFSWTLFVGVLVGLFAGVVTDGVFVSILPASLGPAATGIIAFIVAAFVAYLFVIAIRFVAGMGKRRAVSPSARSESRAMTKLGPGEQSNSTASPARRR